MDLVFERNCKYHQSHARHRKKLKSSTCHKRKKFLMVKHVDLTRWISRLISYRKRKKGNSYFQGWNDAIDTKLTFNRDKKKCSFFTASWFTVSFAPISLNWKKCDFYLNYSEPVSSHISNKNLTICISNRNRR